MASIRGWTQYWYEEPIHQIHGILIECYIFIIDGLLDLERYITIRTHWRRVSVFVVQYATSIMNLYRSTALGLLNTVSNATWKSQRTWSSMGPFIDSSMCYIKLTTRVFDQIMHGPIPCKNLNSAMMLLKLTTWSTTIPRGTKDSSQVVQGTHQ